MLNIYNLCLISVLELFDSYDPEVGFGGIHGRGRRKQDPPIESELYLTLEEVFKGCVKKMKISRRVRTVLQYAFLSTKGMIIFFQMSIYLYSLGLLLGPKKVHINSLRQFYITESLS